MFPEYGKWKVVKKIGSGSFGTVYEIEREDFGVKTKAALKVISIPPDQAEVSNIRSQGMSEESITEYFRGVAEEVVKEFELMSKLKGITNIVSYEDHQVELNKNGVGWNILIRMELLTSLNRYLLEHEITRQDVIQLGIGMCRALERCQKFNIIHRDIKPDNIFVSDSGDFKLGDFGIARTVEKTLSDMSRKGTYTYMAPEVYKGNSYGYSVDLYSLGIVMYRLLNNNRAPFMPPYPEKISYRDQEQALVKRMSGEKLPMPCQESGRLAEIVIKACSYAPEDRYSSPVQMREELEALLYSDQERREIIQTEEYIPMPPAESTLNRSAAIHPFNSEQGTASAAAGNAGAEEEAREAEQFAGEKGTVNLWGRKKNRAEEYRGEIPEQSQHKERRQQAEQFLAKPSPPLKRQEPRKEKKRIGLWVSLAGAVAAIAVAVGLWYFTTTTAVPNIVGMTEAEAQEELARKDLVCTSEYSNSDEVEKGCVISVEHGGQRVKKGTEIQVVYSKGAKIQVPNVVEQSGEEIQKQLLELGLSVRIDTSYSTDYPDGTIMAQSLNAEESVDEGTLIVLTVSLGSEPFELTNYTGKAKKDAQSAAEEAGLTVKIKKAYSTEVKKGKVIKQSPEGGSTIKQGDTLTLWVSRGPEQVKVPDLSGMTQAEAKQALEEVGLKLGDVEEVYSDNTASGKVTGQSVNSETKVNKGSSVSVSISKGKEPETSSERKKDNKPSRKKNNSGADIDAGDIKTGGDDDDSDTDLEDYVVG